MNFVNQEIVVQGIHDEGPGAGVRLAGDLFTRIERTVRPCVRMALTGRSAKVGHPPAWLKTACNVRALGFSRRDADLVLEFGVPTLGEAAPRAFEQGLLFEKTVTPEETALDLMSTMLHDVRDRKVESNTYDGVMLSRLAGWESMLRTSITVVMPRKEKTPTSVLDDQLVQGAKELNRQIPAPRQVRVVGRVDMVRYSTRSLGLRLDGGDEVRCAVVNEQIADLRGYGNREVTVLGKAIYRPSGSLLRLDVEAILDTIVGRDQFNSVPLSFEQKEHHERRPQNTRNGVAAIFGTWPGEETDNELLTALAEMHG